jgi:hypothetical protein
MAFTLLDVRDSLAGLLRDDAPFLTANELDEHISRAVRQVNHDFPFRLVKDITGDNTRDYAMPTEFQKGFSDIESVEVPAGEIPPVFRDRGDDWFIYEDPTQSPVLRLKFKETTPTATETIRVILTTPHTLTSATSTVEDERTFLGIIYKAAVFAFRGLAARFAQTTNPTIDANTVDFAGRSQNFLFLSERWEQNYRGIIGRAEQTKPAQAFEEVDVVFMSGEDFLFHPRRKR